MKTFADKVIELNKSLEFRGTLPAGIRIMNPYKDESALAISSCFYKKYYDDYNKRNLILGINPGRFGGGVTGIPFTDTKRLASQCGIPYQGPLTHEVSSVFIYDMIREYGGEAEFYGKFYINAVSPLGFTSMTENGKEVNYNYYDSKELLNSVYEFIVENMMNLVNLGIETEVCFFLGTGKNQNFFRRLNEQYHFFRKIIALEHPRYIMQYRSKKKMEYIAKYVQAFSQV
jgi:hypothetical protein